MSKNIKIPNLLNMTISKLHAHDYKFDEQLRFEELFISYESIHETVTKSTLEFGIILQIYDEGNKSKDGKVYGSTNFKYLSEIGVGIKFKSHKYYIWKIIRRREVLGYITDDIIGRTEYLDRDKIAYYLKELFPLIDKLRVKIFENEELLLEIGKLEKINPDLVDLEKEFEEKQKALGALERKLWKSRGNNYDQSKTLLFKILDEQLSDYEFF